VLTKGRIELFGPLIPIGVGLLIFVPKEIDIKAYLLQGLVGGSLDRGADPPLLKMLNFCYILTGSNNSKELQYDPQIFNWGP
jgi:hypothetical protein